MNQKLLLVKKKTEVAYQTKEVIAHQFGEQTLKLHYALDAIAFRQPEAWKEEIKVSVSKLLADLQLDFVVIICRGDRKG